MNYLLSVPMDAEKSASFQQKVVNAEAIPRVGECYRLKTGETTSYYDVKTVVNMGTTDLRSSSLEIRAELPLVILHNKRDALHSS
ncbi:MAG TPA: hypothetical protein VHA12_00255 [Candidatus Nanoarchaeia archaeon]|nr:hypothetical protein [Candidatus Nanoarchaeia archaeon]